MAPIQNTFSIIPNAPSAINGNVNDNSDGPNSRPSRPMTTKQAKKAYQKKNKGPKISKAEQRRQELFEQDRIRKEFEKEKSQARAKAARDKKKEKEDKERADRRKKGLPLVEVHPSQDTLARFVRPAVKKQEQSAAERPKVVTRAAQKEEKEDEHDHGDSDSGILSGEADAEPPAKKQRVEGPEHAKAISGKAPGIETAVDTSATSVLESNDKESPEKPVEKTIQGATPKPCDHDIDESTLIELIDQQLLDTSFGSISSPPKDQKPPQHGDAVLQQDQDVPDEAPPPRPPELPTHPHNEHKEPPQEQQREPSPRGKATLPPARLPLQELSTRATNTNPIATRQKAAPVLDKPHLVSHEPVTKSPLQVSRNPQTSIPAPRTFRHPKTPMAPPPLPPKFKSPHHAGHVPGCQPRPPQFLKPAPPPSHHGKMKSGQDPVVHRVQDDSPPTSTQLFMFSHLEDLFPSPSQEVRELFEEPKLESPPDSGQKQPRGTKQLSELPTKHRPTARSSTTSKPNKHTLAPKTNKHGSGQGEAVQVQQSKKPPSLLETSAQTSKNPDAFDLPFFSTQDLFLSSQDIQDIEDETASPSKAQATMPGDRIKPPTTSRNFPSHARILSNNRTSVSDAEAENDSNPTAISKPHLRSRSTGSRHQSALSQRSDILVPPLKEASAGIDHPIQHEQRSQSHLGTRSGSCQDHGSHSRGLSVRPDQTESMALPRPSPKPFFTSSGRESRFKYAIERSKTTAWEDTVAQRKAQEVLERIQKEEDERMHMLLENLVEDGDCAVTNQAHAVQKNSTAPARSQQGGRNPQTVNQLASSASRCTQSQKPKHNDGEGRARNRPKSSYEQMLEMLSRKESGPQETEVTASQETDYGDGWDDELCDIL